MNNFRFTHYKHPFYTVCFQDWFEGNTAKHNAPPLPPPPKVKPGSNFGWNWPLNNLMIKIRQVTRVEVKVNMSLRFNWASRHEGVLGDWRYSSTVPRILDLGTRLRWVVSFTPRERAPVTHCIGDWVGPRGGLDTVVKSEIPSSCRNSSPRSSSP
jgi:hypothetical protein